MKLPYLNEIKSSREFIDVFRGYNHNLRIGDGEFYDMKNLSSDKYPVLSTRQARGVEYSSSQTLNGIIAKDELWHVEGKNLYVGDKLMYINNNLTLSLSEGPKQLVSMGAYIIIFPDAKYVNTVPKDDGYYSYGSIESTIEYTDALVCPSDKYGIYEYKNITKSATQPAASSYGDVWIDTANIWHRYTTGWEIISTPSHVKLKAEGLGGIGEKGDTVNISYILGLSGEYEIVHKDDDYIIIEAVLDKSTSYGTVKFRRPIPKMDFVVASGNRLWGCRYGENNRGEEVNEIYASKLGDFKQWYSFEGISTDSYFASLGCDGPFTGAATYLGNPIFFKENHMIRVYGDYPANYHIDTSECRGVQSGCEGSIATINEILYYKTRSGICAFDGSLPVDISAPLGDERYSNAVAGTLGNKYYISMKDRRGAYNLFVYDTVKGLWHREDDTEATYFAEYDGDLYYIDRATNQIRSVRGSGVRDESPISWMAETGVIGLDSPDKKYVSRIDVRIGLDVGSVARVWAQYDSGGDWELICTLKGTSLRSFSAPIRPKRCDHMKLRFEGVGDVTIFSICKTVEEGSEL